jgi:uncharacterized protein YneF (UPF0154 family)
MQTHGLTAIINAWVKGDCEDSIEHIISVVQLCIKNDAMSYGGYLSYRLVYNYLSNEPPICNAPPKAKGGALYQNKGHLPSKNRIRQPFVGCLVRFFVALFHVKTRKYMQ